MRHSCYICKTSNSPTYHWANLSQYYKKDINDFWVLCPKCHARFDLNLKKLMLEENHLQQTLYIVCGLDHSGKTTLIEAINKVTKGHIFHSSYNHSWNIIQYHLTILGSAKALLQYQDVIFDRWMISEVIYGKAYRGASMYDDYDVDKMILNLLEGYKINNVKFIMCKPHIDDFEKNKARGEMFDSMNPALEQYNAYMGKTSLPWILYDYKKEGKDLSKFVRDLIK